MRDRHHGPSRRWIAVVILVIAVGCYGVEGVAQRADHSGGLSDLSLLQAALSVLNKHPLVEYQRSQIDVDRGLKQQASAVFDNTVSAGLSKSRNAQPLTVAEQQQYAMDGLLTNSENTDLTQFNARDSRMLRSGVSVAASLLLVRDVDNVASPDGVTTATSDLKITIPLLRGLGRAAVTAQERSAEIEVAASRFDYSQLVSQLLYGVATDYWNLRAAQLQVAISREAETRAKEDLDNTKALVEGDQLPRANLNEVNANLAQETAARIAAEQSEVAARYRLGLDMGIDATKIPSHSLKLTDAFPKTSSQGVQALDRVPVEVLIKYALLHRGDYLAAQKRIEERELAVTAAKNNLKPQLNIEGDVGYSGLSEGTNFVDDLEALGSNVHSPNASAGITYRFAPKNDASRGALAEALALETQAKSQSQQISHSIVAAVLTAVRAVRSATLQESKANEAVAFYRKSLEAQREKYRLGMASVVDVLTVEGLLTNAMSGQVQAQLAYALALTQLRYATGSFVTPGSKVQTIGLDVFVTLPDLEGGAEAKPSVQ